MKINPHAIFLYSVCATLLVCGGCASRAKTSEPAAKEAAAATPTLTPTPELSDPTCCGFGHGRGNSEGVAEAWQQFTKDGRYRLARDADMRYPEVPRDKPGYDWRDYPHTFVYAWGRRNFETEKDHLAAIVLDTTKEGPNNFGLIMFSFPTGGQGYQPYWVFRDRDLSRARLSAPSGYLMFSEQADDGTFVNGCDIFWNKHRRQFVCVPMKK